MKVASLFKQLLYVQFQSLYSLKGHNIDIPKSSTIYSIVYCLNVAFFLSHHIIIKVLLMGLINKSKYANICSSLTKRILPVLIDQSMF